MRFFSSDLRQIPDNQEVFISSRTETSLVVEVLSMVEDGLASTDLWEALKYVPSPPLLPPPRAVHSNPRNSMESSSSLLTTPNQIPLPFHRARQRLAQLYHPHPQPHTTHPIVPKRNLHNPITNNLDRYPINPQVQSRPVRRSARWPRGRFA